VLVLLLLLGGGLAALVLALRAAGRLDLRRAVLARVPVAVAWTALGDVSALLGRHGRRGDGQVMDSFTLRHGDGLSGGSVWRAHGRRDGLPYWADLEIVRCEPLRELRLSLVGDVLGIERRLRGHTLTLRLEPVGPMMTKLTWRLSARLGPALALQRMVAPQRLAGRLFDRSLRSIKLSLEAEDARPPAEPSAAGAAPEPAVDPLALGAPGERTPPEASA
jgi:hypothetical protein